MGGWVGWLMGWVGGWMDGCTDGRTDKEEKDSDRCTLANPLSLPRSIPRCSVLGSGPSILAMTMMPIQAWRELLSSSTTQVCVCDCYLVRSTT